MSSKGKQESKHKGDRGEVNARIIKVDKESCIVALSREGSEEQTREVLVETDAVRWKDRTAPAVGDFVLLKEAPEADGFLLHKILPRKTALYRKDPGGFAQAQVIAANMDIVALVHGMDQKLSLAKLERGLVLAAESEAEAMIILSKSDLVEEAQIEETIQKVRPLIVHPLMKGSVDILVTSKIIDPETGHTRGTQELNQYLKGGKTLVLLGSSGAGKSTLVNSLIFESTQKTTEVRSTDSRGRHATVVRSLIPLPEGGFIIDTPGLRAIGLGDTGAGIGKVFYEISELSKKCKFRDCAHIQEPDCAVKAAVKSGELPPERLERFQKLTDEASQSQRDLEEVRRKRRN